MFKDLFDVEQGTKKLICMHFNLLFKDKVVIYYSPLNRLLGVFLVLVVVIVLEMIGGIFVC